MRPIYWRVTTENGHIATGTFTDLKTLRGATRRLRRRVPAWREIEARFDEGPFTR